VYHVCRLQRIQELDSVPKDLAKPWEDPAANMADRQLAMGMRGQGLKVQYTARHCTALYTSQASDGGRV
jgi:hypothetical protein